MRFTFKKKKQPEHDGPRQYKQMAISPEAHAIISNRAAKKGDSIIDTVDKMLGIQ